MASLRAALTVIAALVGLGCGTHEADGVPDVTPRDLPGLVQALRDAGATVTSGGEVQQPFFRVAGRVLAVNGEEVQVFQFEDDGAARAAASAVSADGSTVGTVMVTWIAPPHFYRTGPLIALYVGSTTAITRILESVMGAQFAGR